MRVRVRVIVRVRVRVRVRVSFLQSVCVKESWIQCDLHSDLLFPRVEGQWVSK